MSEVVQPVQVIACIDVHPSQAFDVNDLLAAIHARLADEAGYLGPDGDPIEPMEVRVAVLSNPYA